MYHLPTILELRLSYFFLAQHFAVACITKWSLRSSSKFRKIYGGQASWTHGESARRLRSLLCLAVRPVSENPSIRHFFNFTVCISPAHQISTIFAVLWTIRGRQSIKGLIGCFFHHPAAQIRMPRGKFGLRFGCMCSLLSVSSHGGVFFAWFCEIRIEDSHWRTWVVLKRGRPSAKRKM